MPNQYTSPKDLLNLYSSSIQNSPTISSSPLIPSNSINNKSIEHINVVINSNILQGPPGPPGKTQIPIELNFPTNPSEGDTVFIPSHNMTYIYYDSTWKPVLKLDGGFF